MLAEQSQGLLVDGVEIRALLAVDLDVDEELVHEVGDALILEALMRHHMAPMAGRVAHREQDRLVVALRLGQSVLAPDPPVHRVHPVLQQIGGSGFAELVLGVRPWRGVRGHRGSFAGRVQDKTLCRAAVQPE
jgi:hypothetical protein